jgi:hypothetical protein
MQNMTEDSKENIRKKVALFTEPTIGDECPKNLCFCACFPLQLFLKINNIHCSLTGGDYNGTRHFWLTVNGYENIIIDPTIRQFKSQVETIYIGSMTSEYTPDTSSFNETFSWAFKFWAEPILDRPRSHQEKPIWLEERTNFYNIKFAMILNQEISQKNPETITMHHNRLCKLYFGTILKFLKLKTQNDQDYIRNLRATLPQSFENLLNQTNTGNC